MMERTLNLLVYCWFFVAVCACVYVSASVSALTARVQLLAGI